MKHTTPQHHSQDKTNDPLSRGYVRPKAGPSYTDPLDYPSYPYPCMRDFARLLATRYDSNRTRHGYYRHLRLLQEHFDLDPASLGEEELRDYILHVKTRKHWASQTIRQAAAVSRLFFVEMLGVKGWKVFGQIRTKDSGKLPGVLTRLEVIRLLCHIRLRRYRTPVKLIYCAGLRLSEPSRPGQAARWTVDAGDSPKGEAAAGRLSNQCLSLTIHDIKPDHLIVRDGSRTLRGRGETDSPEASP